MSTSPVGLFVGLTTLDLIYRAASPPTANQKIVAMDYAVAAGGPATNAAVAFGQAGGRATVLTSLGRHPMTQLIRADLADCQMAIADLTPAHPEPPPVSSIVVTAATGDRAVVCINAVKRQAEYADIPAEIWAALTRAAIDVVLIDGHQIEVGRAIAQHARAHQIPTVLDGGSWKPGLEQILPFIDYAICSANFRAPDGGASPIHAYLADFGITQVAITHGGQPINYWSAGKTGVIAIPAIAPVDTLGAGDIFHGAFCAAILHQDFATALATAAQTASRSCQSFGTRRWMQPSHDRGGEPAVG
jgi:sugar/nucleoside kinase (ribokinase family)